MPDTSAAETDEHPYPVARPARSCVGVAALPYGGCVEVEGVARTRTDRGGARAA